MDFFYVKFHFIIAIYTACNDITGIITCLTLLSFEIELRYELRIFVLRFVVFTDS